MRNFLQLVRRILTVIVISIVFFHYLFNMDVQQMTTYIEYHSLQWEKLVESGWITWTVDNGIAKMILLGNY